MSLLYITFHFIENIPKILNEEKNLEYFIFYNFSLILMKQNEEESIVNSLFFILKIICE